MSDNTQNPYADLLDLPHPSFPQHPRMSMLERAAQFSPFAALTGYDAAVQETARITQREILLDEQEQEELNLRLQLLLENLQAAPPVQFTLFVPDEKKSGGRYETVQGTVRRMDLAEQLVILQDGRQLPLDRIYQIDSPLFQPLEEAAP